MSAAWKEAKEGVVSLPEDEPEIFKLYLQWLYNDTIPCEEKGPDHADHVEEYLRLSKAYVLGDKLQDGDFQNEVLDAIVDKCRHKVFYPCGPAVRYIYDNTLPSSPARRLIVNIYVFHASKVWLTQCTTQDEQTKEFFYDLSVVLLDADPLTDPISTYDSCEYHHHGERPCYNSQYCSDGRGSRYKYHGIQEVPKLLTWVILLPRHDPLALTSI